MMKWHSLLLGGLISGACIYVLLSRVDLQKTAESFGRADPLWLIVSLITIAVAVLGRAWRWQLLFLPQDRVSLYGTTSSTLIGYMFNTVLPGRVGELVRAGLLAQSEQVGTTRAIGTIFVEKILDVLVLLILLGVLTTVLPLPNWLTAAGLSAATIFGALAIIFFALSSIRGSVVTWVAAKVDPLPMLRRLRPSHIVDTVLAAAEGLRDPRLLVMQLVTSAAIWTVALSTVATILEAFQLRVPLSAAALILVTTNLGMTIPSAPGYVGVYHAIAVATLTIFGIEESEALSFAVTLHALAFGSFTIAGAILLLVGIGRQQYSWSKLSFTR